MAGADPIEELVSLLSRLPGVGERTATRLAFFILGEQAEYSVALGDSLREIQARVKRCERCGNYGATTVCRICEDTKRSSATLCVVARVPDLVAIERSGTFRGRYHVLHRLLAPLEGIGPSDLDLDRLRARIESEGVKEVIVATPLSVEGEATALFVADELKDTNVMVSRIASGVPHGGELEFTDQVTLGRAFDGRRTLGG